MAFLQPPINRSMKANIKKIKNMDKAPFILILRITTLGNLEMGTCMGKAFFTKAKMSLRVFGKMAILQKFIKMMMILPRFIMSTKTNKMIMICNRFIEGKIQGKSSW